MTDRELLEAAARAAGLVGFEYCAPWRGMAAYNKALSEFYGETWNPLLDDGDALRLAVALMQFEPYKSRGFLPCITSDARETRRAIVRAAAAMAQEGGK